MDMRKVKKLIELLQSTGVAEIEIKEGEESVRITANKAPQMVAMPTAAPMPMPTAPAPVAAPAPAPTAAPSAPAADKHTVKAPMVGTVYLSSTPGAKAFVEIGQTVKAGEVICLIEAMKMFNQIEADKAGTITARLVDNGSPVEYNQPLFVIE
ncbi:MAG TPA: acetyl-CoA carboxylase biotin carboxyl carrier protein [Gammaproteobacteria bacterium]|jgi:acetyl-CoA carboxylase biotin carboxyl carrier protein|nr:acetyl-CoA carboxylase biotin carboxyl carrier protein [Gammaproteobacteria bacterium]